MALGLTEEHLALAESVRGLAQRHSGPAAVRSAAGSTDAGAAQYFDAIAPRLAEQGLFGLHVAEADGGQGFGLPELAIAVEETGRALLPGAFLPTVLASAVLAETGRSGKIVGTLANGARAGAVSLAGGLSGISRPDGGLSVSGQMTRVLGAPMADLIIAPVQIPGGETWVALEVPDVEITAQAGLDLTRPLGSVRADGVEVPPERVLAGVSRAHVTSLAAIVCGAEACGIADWAVQTAAEYAKLRHQFGRPIGQFQAVKHRCARMLTAAEQAAAAVWDAARTGPDADGSAGEREFAASVAAAVAFRAAVSAADSLIQTLGGIGYTWEHPAHLYLRRAMSVCALAGQPGRWQERAARLALSGVTRPVRAELPDGDDGFRAAVRAELAGIAPLSGGERAERLAAGGWVVPHLPRPWGRDAAPLEQLVIEQEMRAAGIRAPGLAIGAWVVPALIRYGTPEQQQRFLPPTLRGDFLWCQLFSEPGAGSDLAGISTRAERADGGWRITGQKIWTSLAREASWAICIARTGPPGSRHDGISYFLLDMHAAGVDVKPLREITGDSLFNEVFLDDVFVPGECLVGEVNGGWRIARTTLANERISLSQSWAFGAGVPELIEVAKAAEDPPLREIGELVCDGQAISLLGLRVTLKRLSGTEPGATGSVRKLLGMRHSQAVAEICWAMSGGPGADAAAGGLPTSSGGPNGAHWARQVLLTRALTIGGGTTDIQLNIIGERMLGLPRDPDPPAS